MGWFSKSDDKKVDATANWPEEVKKNWHETGKQEREERDRTTKDWKKQHGK